MRKSMLWAVTAAGLVCLAMASPASADVKAGVEAWSRGDYKKAVDIWKADADRGDADAQFNLGQAYRFGRGVPVDLPIAATWFHKAALQGHIEGETNYGLTLFDQGRHAEALPWLERSVSRGEPRAQMTLGTMLYNGDGVSRDLPRAYALLIRSAASGLPRAVQVQAEMDHNIPLAERQKGLELAAQYEVQASRPVLPREINRTSEHAIQFTTVLPSNPLTVISKPGVRTSPATHSRREAEVEHASLVHKAVSPTQAAPNTGWRVQLGAFGDSNNARKLWSRVSGHFAGRQPAYTQAGSITRLSVGFYASRADAMRACGAVRPCVPVGQ